MGCGDTRQQCELCQSPIRLRAPEGETIQDITVTGPCRLSYCGADECGINITGPGTCQLVVVGSSGRMENLDLVFAKADIHWDACCGSHYFSTGQMIIPVLAMTR